MFWQGGPVSEETGGGIRERKKLATREALSWAALSLAVERGLDEVRVEDIAAKAGVSPRTFNNYFSSKEAAIVAIGADRIARIALLLRERPRSEPLWKALLHAVTSQFDGREPDRAWVARVRLITSTPALHAEYLKAGAQMARGIAEAVAERTGTDAEKDLFPRLVAAAVVSTEQVAIDHWLTSKPKKQLVSVIQDAFEQVAAGLPAPR
jgi:AcrR family transcriptional regulator